MELYKLTGEMITAIQMYQSAETDEELTNAERVLTALEVPFQEKAISVARHILNQQSDIVALKEEILRLETKKEHIESHVNSIKRYLQLAMEGTQNTKIESPTVKLAIQNNPPSVIIEDESLVPDKYKRIIPERKEIDKQAIKDAWKAGIGVEGTRIEVKQSLRIK